MNKSKYSTVIITDKHSHDTKIYSIRQKHIENIVLYKKILLYSVIGILSVLTVLVSYIGHEYYQKQELHGKITGLEKRLDSKKLDRMIDNLDKAEESLLQIENYLKEREVKTFVTSETEENVGNVGGEYYPIDNINADLIEARKERIADLLKKIQYVPIGLPHIGRLTSDFGVRGNPVEKGNGLEFHSGLDLAGKIGDPVHATANGKVIFAHVKGGYGNCIIIKHDFGYETLYGHLSKIKVKKGQEVKAGEIIGELGNSGRSTGPHIHYEVICNKEKKNPNRYLQIE
jgi:murein DD-endopeptidase MepM/ murein hydrolase activator NlpD